MKACKRKNPLNIRYSSRNKWKGQIGNSHGFCSFISMEYGVRASLVLLRSYIRRGYNTIDLIINRWAPPSENNTEAYIAFVSGKTKIDRHTVISDTDKESISHICSAMAWLESMSKLSLDELNRVWNEYV